MNLNVRSLTLPPLTPVIVSAATTTQLKTTLSSPALFYKILFLTQIKKMFTYNFQMLSHHRWKIKFTAIKVFLTALTLVQSYQVAIFLFSSSGGDFRMSVTTLRLLWKSEKQKTSGNFRACCIQESCRQKIKQETLVTSQQWQVITASFTLSWDNHQDNH